MDSTRNTSFRMLKIKVLKKKIKDGNTRSASNLKILAKRRRRVSSFLKSVFLHGDMQILSHGGMMVPIIDTIFAIHTSL